MRASHPDRLRPNRIDGRSTVRHFGDGLDRAGPRSRREAVPVVQGPCRIRPPRLRTASAVRARRPPSFEPPSRVPLGPGMETTGSVAPASAWRKLSRSGRFDTWCRAPAGIASALPGNRPRLRPAVAPPGAARRRAGPVGSAPGRCLRCVGSHPHAAFGRRDWEFPAKARSPCSVSALGRPSEFVGVLLRQAAGIGVRRRAAAFGRRGAATSRSTGATCAACSPGSLLRARRSGVRQVPSVRPTLPRGEVDASKPRDPLFPRPRRTGGAACPRGQGTIRNVRWGWGPG